MRKSSSLPGVAALAVALALSTGCNLFSNSKDSGSSSTSSSNPTAPSAPSVSMDAFAGTWASVTASTPATGCGNVKYIVTPVSSSSATVTFSATCGGAIAVNGSGTGALSGSTLTWSANGLVGQGGVNCPFTFANGKATQDSASTNIVITYAGTVCGIPVNGTETVKK
jgi:hypothetical protein